jgi:hypothetical protein
LLWRAATTKHEFFTVQVQMESAVQGGDHDRDICIGKLGRHAVRLR